VTGLQDLGLSEHEAAVYTTLVERGRCTAKRLSREADVPLGRVYDVVDSLEERRMVRVQHDAHPRTVTAVDPESAIDGLLSVRREQAADELARLERVADDVRAEFERTGVVTGERFVTTALGAAEAYDLLVDRYAGATEDLLLVFREPPAGADIDADDTPIDVLQAVREEGVEVRILLSTEALAAVTDAHRSRLAALVAEHDVSARVSDAVDRTLAVVDGVEVCLEIRTPTSRDLFALVDLRDARFTRQYRAEILDIWEGAERLRLDPDAP